ncbi:phosphatase PAP2 family protein [Candidatus Saccharibacteria bacterium]|nr:phosphatase PAP2 family protein [Candidatus Saccharibacteria bacterium]
MKKPLHTRQSLYSATGASRALLHRIAIATVIFGLGLALFVAIALAVHLERATEFDIAVTTFIQSWRSPELTVIFKLISDVSGPFVLPLIVIGLLVWAYVRRLPGKFWFMLVALGGSAISNLILKAVFDRARPDMMTWLIQETGLSFPSGHAMASMSFVLTVIIILWNTRWRRLSIILGAISVLLVGISRLYLGVHYPTDVIAGWGVAAAWVFIVLVAWLDVRLHHLSATK